MFSGKHRGRARSAGPRRVPRAGTAAAGLLTAVLVCAVPAPAAGEPASGGPDLTELSLEELMDLEVTSVSRKGEQYWRAAAAVFVITGDDLRRSGVTHLADALRLVPGMQVAQIDSNGWAVSARGFNNRFSNKLLVLIDGRSIYTPAFSGVFWDVQDVLLEEVDRIEVIRGPGGTLWGANAVNGVINIITKPSHATQGGLIALGGGNEEESFTGLRYGGEFGGGTYRAYAKWFDRASHETVMGTSGFDRWDAMRAGFRVDWGGEGADGFTLQGDVYDGTSGKTLATFEPAAPFVAMTAFDRAVSGTNLIGRWTRTRSEDSRWTMQLYYDRTRRDEGYLHETRDTYDADFLHGKRLSDRQEIVWGLGYRRSVDDYRDTESASVEEDRDDIERWSAFIQDEIHFARPDLRLVLGTKVEHNSYTGFEVQPNLRFAWHPGGRRTLWAALSRGVRTPSRAGRDISLNLGLEPVSGGIVRLVPNDDVGSEELIAIEAGFRVRPIDRLSLDTAVFFSHYDGLEASVPGEPFVEPDPPPAHLVIPLVLVNGAEADSRGVEVSADLRASESWRLLAGWTWLKISQKLNQLPPGSGLRDEEEDNPSHQLFLRSAFDLPGRVELDAIVRYVDDLPAKTGIVGGRERIDSYTALDVSLIWSATDKVELTIVGRNLLDDSQTEFIDSLLQTPASLHERSGYVKATWRF